MAQSVGGGGGMAGSAVGMAAIPVYIGGQGDVAGNGGDVSVTNSGSIVIEGDNSIGIFAQSIGGGGGLVQPGGGATSITLKSGGDGKGGVVTVTNTAGSIRITGDNSIALYSQSVGGGGGAVGLASDLPGQIGAFKFSGTANGDGIADEAIINQTGDLIAPGHNSIALTAQSSALDDNGNITVNILNSGSTRSLIYGGSDQGAGVMILNGDENNLNNNGIITNVQDVDGYAVRATTGNDNIHNYGLVIGSVDLEAGAHAPDNPIQPSFVTAFSLPSLNSFDNAQDAIFNSGVTVYLGPGNLLSNEGLLSPGAYDRVMTTELTGDFSQFSTGVFGADLDLRNQITDRLDVSGTGDVSGTIAVNLIDPTIAPGYATPGEHANTLLYTVGNLVYQDISLVAPNTAVATYSLAYIEDPEIDLNYLIDYAPDGLTQNQHSVGTLVNQIQTAQVSPDFRPIATALFFQPDVPVLAKIYDSLSGEGIADFEQSGIYANDLFLKSIAGRIGCWVLNDTVSPCGRSLFEKPVNREKTSSDWKVWMNGYIGSGDGEGDSVVGSANTYYKSRGFAVGIDRQVTPDAVFGFATGYNHSALDVPQRATKGIIDSWHVAGYGAVRNENLYLRGTLAYDHIDNKEFRHAYIPTAYYDAVDGDHYVIDGFDNYISTPFISSLWSGDIELGYNNHFGEFVVTPFAGLKFGAWHMNGFTETDAERNPSRIGLTYQDRTVTSLPARLGVQLTKQTELSANSLLSLSLRTAWVHEFHPDRTLESSFTAAPGFTNIIHGAQQYDDVLETSIGIDLCSNNNVTLFGKFECNILKPTNNYSGIFGLQVLF
ncbi:MAG: autotransporter domain-containing protein [Chlorobiaceae bacterium]|nr:autotransporter domain-containing protein [Chlorobiaceae bacterium]